MEVGGDGAGNVEVICSDLASVAGFGFVAGDHLLG